MRPTFPCLRTAICTAVGFLFVACDDRAALPTGPSVPPSLAVVHTLAQLRSQAPVALRGGITARVGIERDHAANGSRVLVYCLIPSDPMPANPHAFGEHALGPFTITWKVDGGPGPLWDDGIGSGLYEKSDGDLLFIASVPASGTTTVITLTDTATPGPKPTLASATVAVTAPEPVQPPWTALTYPEGAMDQEQESHEDLVVAPAQCARNQVARPKWDGDRPWTVRPTWTDLPVTLPAQPDVGLRLQASATALDITSDQPLELGSPLEVVLVRWWVNGQGVMPNGPPETDALLDEAGRLMPVLHLRFELSGLSGLGAKSGDRVAVQALLCPGGWEVDSEQIMKQLSAWMDTGNAGPPWPRLSKRVEFVMP